QMLQKLMERRHNKEEGFTLIELMVVVLIIAILIAIAIPTFLGARTRANNRFPDNNSYANADATALSAVEPSLTFAGSATASTGAKMGSVHPVSATQWAAAVLSASGTCYYIQDQSNGPGTQFGSGTTCTGAAAAANTTWSSSFP